MAGLGLVRIPATLEPRRDSLLACFCGLDLQVKLGHKGSICNKNPLECDHGAMGRYLIVRFMLDTEVLPDPRDDEKWSVRCCSVVVSHCVIRRCAMLLTLGFFCALCGC